MPPFTKTILASALLGISFMVQTQAAKQPNILFIMSDDHTTQAVGAYGGRLTPLNPTPALDSLAASGIRFDNVFCNNSICSPSRATILSGQYSSKNGVKGLSGGLSAAQQYLPIEMKKLGYQTAIVGKWHLYQEPGAFDYYCVFDNQGKYTDPLFLVRGPKGWEKDQMVMEGWHSSDAITDLSLEWLKNGRDKSKPFMLMHHFKAAHSPYKNAERYDSFLEGVEIPEPENLYSPPSGSAATKGLGHALGQGKKDKIGSLDPKKQAAAYQQTVKEYLRCVKGIDDNVQRLVDYLREAGELENTIIVYTADQGYFLGEHALVDKRWMFDEALRMPFIVSWAGHIKPGQANDWLIDNADFAPTLLEMAGLKQTPEYMQGRSFAAALRGESKPANWRTFTYYRYWEHGGPLQVPSHFGIRSDRYKLIFFIGKRAYGSDKKNEAEGSERSATTPGWEFYDLESDPLEMSNQYNNPEYRAIIEQMKAQLKETQLELGETPDDNPAIQSIIDQNWDQ